MEFCEPKGKEKQMDDWQIPLKSIYRAVIDFRLEANCDNYIEAGWQPLGIHADINEFIRTKKGSPFYRVGWLRGGGEPIHPPIIDELAPPRFQDFGSATD